MKKAAKKEKKAAKLAAKAQGGKPKKGDIEAAPVPAAIAPAPAASADVESAPQPTGTDATEAGALTQRPPRATVEEVEDE
jgi:translocation protein SEC62